MAGYGAVVGMDDDEDCTHVFDLEEVVATPRGADQVLVCQLCGTPVYEPGQAAVRDTRPPL
ncbi:hypothetical protein HIDPHFAB_02993 [Nocardioides sp. T2.26MG-1]|nr:hypothetical protein HIDPHFAB_02993 [Nocardioides sp. T2.26MG-1]